MAINLTTLNTIGVVTTDSASLTISLGEDRTAANNAVYSLVDFNAAAGDNDFSYELQSGNRNLFSIDAGTGVLRYTGSLKYSDADSGGTSGDGTGGVYILVVRAKSKTTASSLLETVVFKVGYDASNIAFKSPSVSLNIEEAIAKSGYRLLPNANTGVNTDPGTTISYVLTASDGSHYHGYEQHMFSIDAAGNVAVKNDLNYSYLYSQYNAIKLAGEPSAEDVLQNFSLTVKAFGTVMTRDASGEKIVTTILRTQDIVVHLDHVTDVLTWGVTASGALSLTENNQPNQLLGNYESHNNSNFAITYGLSGADAKYFSVDSSGKLLFVSALDADNGHAANYSIVLFSGSNAGPDHNLISKAITLSLTNINDEQTKWINTSDKFAVSENTVAGVAVATFLATDADGSTATGISYWLGGVDKDLFSLDSNHGLHVKSQLDYDTYENAVNRHGLYTVVVNALDTGNAAGTPTNDTAKAAVTQMFVLSLGDADEFASQWVTTPSGVSIPSSQSKGALATFTASDADGSAISYYLTAENDGKGNQSILSHVKIVSKDSYTNANDVLGHNATGALELVDNNFDAVTRFLYSIVVHAKSGLSDLSTLFILSLPHVNGSQTLWSNDPATHPTGAVLNENNAVGDNVATFTPVDVDGPGISYWLSSGNDSAYFTIGTDGKLHVNSVFNYESSDNVNHNQRFTVIVNAIGTAAGAPVAGSPGAIPLTQVFVLSIADVDEFALNWSGTKPDGIAISETNVVGGAIATFVASDADASGISYSLSGADASFFSIVTTNNVHTNGTGVLSFVSALDYDNGHNDGRYTITINTHSGVSDLSTLFILSVGNINDNPTNWVGGQSAGVTISENNAVGVIVANFTATDADGSGFSYWLTGTDADLFTINSNGNLQLASSLNYEDNYHGHDGRFFTIKVNARGTTGGPGTHTAPSIVQDFVLSLGNLNDSANSWVGTQSAGLAISENNTAGVSVATFTATDADGANISYWLTGGDSNLFSLDANNGLHVKSTLDYEANHGHNQRFTVVVNALGKDGGAAAETGQSITQTFILSLGNINDSATAWSGTQSAGMVINENNAAGDSVATFTATDPDGAAISYWLTGADAGLFSMGSGNSLHVRSTLDYEDANHVSHNERYTVVVNARGTAPGAQVTGTPGDNILTQTFILSIGNVNDNATTWSPNPGTSPQQVAGDPINLTGGPSRQELRVSQITNGTVLATFAAADADGQNINYSFTGGVVGVSMDRATGKLIVTPNSFSQTFTPSDGQTFSFIIFATGTDGSNGSKTGVSISKSFVIQITGNNQVDHASVWLDGTTATHAVNIANVLHDASGNDNNATIKMHGMHYDNDVITTSFDPATGLGVASVTHVVNNISDLESLKLSFNGYVDGNGATRNHWYFVQDDANDGTGHIVFDADGKDVQFNAGATAPVVSADELNLLAGNLPSAPGQAWDGGFDPSHLTGTLTLHLDPVTHASALTYDQFIALIGGDAGHITFV